jgi:hypothetical protein
VGRSIFVGHGVYAGRSRTDSSPKRASEPEASSSAGSPDRFWNQVRDVINEWWSHLPDHAQPGVRNRIAVVAKLTKKDSVLNVHQHLEVLKRKEKLIECKDGDILQ